MERLIRLQIPSDVGVELRGKVILRRERAACEHVTSEDGKPALDLVEP